MGHIDDFILAQVTPQLGQGEQIQWLGFVRQPKKVNPLGVVGSYGDSWLAAATNMRLVLMQTQASGLSDAVPQPMCMQVQTWWYQELREVTLGQLKGLGANGLHFGLVPYEPLGPYHGEAKRYDTFAETQGLQGQGAFCAQFPQWLQQQVAAQAFPMDATRQTAVQQHQQGQQLAAAAEMQRQQEAAQRRQEAIAAVGSVATEAAKGAAPWVLPVVMALISLAVIGAGVVLVIDGIEAQSGYSAQRAATLAKLVKVHKANLEVAKKGEEPPDDCPEKELGIRELRDTCHGCYVSGVRQGGTTGKTFTKGDKVWSCPSAEEVEELLDDAKRERKSILRDMEEAQSQVMIGTGVGGLGLLLSIAGTVWLLRRRKRRAAAGG